MAIHILITAVTALFFGGAFMMLSTRRAAQLDASISLWIGHRLSKQMRRRWGSQEEFKKYLMRKKTQMIYKTAGLIAILLAVALTVFFTNIS